MEAIITISNSSTFVCPAGAPRDCMGGRLKVLLKPELPFLYELADIYSSIQTSLRPVSHGCTLAWIGVIPALHLFCSKIVHLSYSLLIYFGLHLDTPVAIFQ